MNNPNLNYCVHCGEEFTSPLTKYQHFCRAKEPNSTVEKLQQQIVELKTTIADNNWKPLQDAKELLKQIVIAWNAHQHTKFKSDGSHFQADLKMNALITKIKNFLPQPPAAGDGAS